MRNQYALSGQGWLLKLDMYRPASVGVPGGLEHCAPFSKGRFDRDGWSVGGWLFEWMDWLHWEIAMSLEPDFKCGVTDDAQSPLDVRDDVIDFYY